MRGPRNRIGLATAAALLALASCRRESDGASGGGRRVELAFISNCVASFWTIASVGAQAAAREADVDCDVRMPSNGIVEQKQLVEDMLARGVAGIAISPIDGENQVELIDQACARTKVITHDSDAPKSKRLCYVGMDNYVAGRMCGKLVKEALPNGGSLLICVGRMEQDNARKRRQGLIDELLGRDDDPNRYDPPGGELRGGKYVILDTRTDQADRARAKANVEDAIVRYADLGCLVGLFAYNPPAILEALKGAGKLGKIQVVAFDEADETLQGILDGHVAGTVVQDPYRYGFESVRILAGLARGQSDVLPKGGVFEIPPRIVRKADARAFWDELKQRLEQGAKSTRK